VSTVPAITMQELELETAELLPSRETLCVWNPCYHYQPCHQYYPCQQYYPCHPYQPCCYPPRPCW
jgi:hypothetical protein